MSIDHPQASPTAVSGQAEGAREHGHQGSLLVFFYQPGSSFSGLKSSLLSTSGSVAGAPSLALFQPGSSDPWAELQASLDANDHARILIVYPNPASALARELSGGIPPAVALDTWKKAAAAPLQLFRRNRRRVLLMDGHAAVSDTRGLAETWRRHTGLALNAPVAQGREELEQTTPVAWFVAQHVLQHDDEASLLLAELEASSLPLALRSSVDVEAVLRQLRSSPGMPDQQQVQELQKEHDLLLLQLQQVQEELQACSRANHELQARPKAGNAAQVKRLRNELNGLRSELDWAQQDLAEIRQSLSWRITAPLRRIFGLFKKG